MVRYTLTELENLRRSSLILGSGRELHRFSIAMKDDSLTRQKRAAISAILLLIAAASNANPMDYEDVNNLLPTEPQTTNDTLAAVVRDPVVQDAVQNAVGNGSLQGLVVKKNVLIMPATEPNKVVSQREQVLVVPVTHLEDVRKNISETVNAETIVDGLVLTDVPSFIEDGEDGYASSVGENDRSHTSQHGDFYEALGEIPEATRVPVLPHFDDAPREIPYFLSNPSPREAKLLEQSTPAISVPIIAFLDPAKVSDDEIEVPIAAAQRDDASRGKLNLPEKGRDDIRRNARNYVDESLRLVDPDRQRLMPPPSKIQAPSSPYERTARATQEANDTRSEATLPVGISRIDVVRPLFWTSDADADYPKDPRDMDVAAHVIFRPLFRFRQEAQRTSYRRGADERRRSAYRRYNYYPRRNYRYKPQYSNDYYY